MARQPLPSPTDHQLQSGTQPIPSLGPNLTNTHKDNFDTPWRQEDGRGLSLHTAVRDNVWECCGAVEWDGRAGNADGGGGESASVEGGGCEGASWRVWVKGWDYGVGAGVVDVVFAIRGLLR